MWLFCTDIIASVPYGYATSATAIDEYFKDINEKVQSWFDKVKNMAKNEGIPGVKDRNLQRM